MSETPLNPEPGRAPMPVPDDVDEPPEPDPEEDTGGPDSQLSPNKD